MGNVVSPVDLIADIAAICAEPAPAADRAAAVLERLHRAIPFEAAALAAYDPVERTHVTVSAVNYEDTVLTYLNEGFVSEDPAWQTMRYRNPTPLRWCDIPGYQAMFSAHEVLMPAGFREGSTTCMFTRDGRYTGALHLNSDTPLPISDSAVDVLAALQRVIAPVVDALAPAALPSWRQLVADADASAMMTLDGHLVDLDDGQRGEILADGAPLARELVALGPDGLPHRYFWTSRDGRCHEVRLTRLAGGTVVTVRRAGAPHSLSPREVEVLSLLAEGLANPEIARVLSLSPRTVATHVEHILAKLGCATRVAAASKAVAEGIVPIPVLDHRPLH
ncbi:hypothetical protein GCM10028801_15690 [Nocardioides maradonensis]